MPSSDRPLARSAARSVLAALLLAAAAGSGAAQGTAQRLDWWALDRDVVRQLATRDVGRWSAELARARRPLDGPGGAALEPQAEPGAEPRAEPGAEPGAGPAPRASDVATLVRGLDVHLRAGHVARAAEAVAALARALPPELTADVETALAATCDMAIERGALDLAYDLCERFPSVEPGSAAELVAELARRSDAAWVDAWIALRAERSSFWFWQRLAARFEQGTLGALVAELEREAAARPASREAHARWRAALRCAEGLVAWEPEPAGARGPDVAQAAAGAADGARTHAARLVAELDAAARRGEPAAVDGELVWAVLARGAWGRHERALLERVAHATHGAAREALWRRAEGLASLAPAERALVLGSILVRTRGEEARGIDWLERALGAAGGARERAAAAFALFEAFLAAGDVERAQAVWPQASEHPPTAELPLWLGALSLEAARQGRVSEALRLWTLRINLDRGELAQLEGWVALGLAQPVAELYRVLEREDPASRAPARALERLAELR